MQTRTCQTLLKNYFLFIFKAGNGMMMISLCLAWTLLESEFQLYNKPTIIECKDVRDVKLRKITSTGFRNEKSPNWLKHGRTRSPFCRYVGRTPATKWVESIMTSLYVWTCIVLRQISTLFENTRKKKGEEQNRLPDCINHQLRLHSLKTAIQPSFVGAMNAVQPTYRSFF